ncbi:hypothetical protein GN956_G15726 [Arapaima gigas]
MLNTRLSEGRLSHPSRGLDTLADGHFHTDAGDASSGRRLNVQDPALKFLLKNLCFPGLPLKKHKEREMMRNPLDSLDQQLKRVLPLNSDADGGRGGGCGGNCCKGHWVFLPSKPTAIRHCSQDLAVNYPSRSQY